MALVLGNVAVQVRETRVHALDRGRDEERVVRTTRSFAADEVLMIPKSARRRLIAILRARHEDAVQLADQGHRDSRIAQPLEPEVDRTHVVHHRGHGLHVHSGIGLHPLLDLEDLIQGALDVLDL